MGETRLRTVYWGQCGEALVWSGLEGRDRAGKGRAEERDRVGKGRAEGRDRAGQQQGSREA